MTGGNNEMRSEVKGETDKQITVTEGSSHRLQTCVGYAKNLYDILCLFLMDSYSEIDNKLATFSHYGIPYFQRVLIGEYLSGPLTLKLIFPSILSSKLYR